MPVEKKTRGRATFRRGSPSNDATAFPETEKVKQEREDASAKIAVLEAALINEQEKRLELEIQIRVQERILQINASRHREELERLGFSLGTPKSAAVPAHNGLQRPDVGPSDRLLLLSAESISSGIASKERIAAAKAAMQSRNWKSAAQRYLDLIAEQPGRAAFWLQYGHALKEAGDRKSARRAYFKALSLEPAAPEIAIHLGHLLASDGEADLALDIFLGGFAASPDSTSIRNVLEESGMDLSDLARSPHGSPKRLKGWRKWLYNKQISAARRFYQDGRWNAAYSRFARMARRHPWNLAVKLPMGHSLTNIGDLRRAEAVYRECTLIQPLNSQAWFSLAKILSTQGNTREARIYFGKAYQLDPDNVEALYAFDNLGGSL